MAGQYNVGGRGGRRGAEYVLSPPEIIGAGIAFHGPGTRLVEPLSARQINPRAAHSRLLAPAVVNPAAVSFVAPPIGVNFRGANHAKRNAGLQRSAPHSHFFGPAAVGAGIVFQPVEIHLAPSKRGVPKSHLGLPVVVGSTAVFRGLLITLAPSKRGKPKSVLSPPAIEPVFSGIRTALAYSRRGTPRSRLLLPPAVIGGGIVFRGILGRLVPSKRGVVKSHLGPPVVVTAAASALFSPPVVHLAPSRRGVPKSRLRSPIIPPVAPPIVERVVSNLVRLEFADRQPRSRLLPPAVVGAGVVFRSLLVHLAPPRRGVPKSRLGLPVVIGSGIVFRPLTVTLAASRRGKPKSTLLPPAIEPVFAGIRVTLVPSKRGRPTYRLAPPAVVGAGVVFRRLAITLAPSHQIGRQRRCRSILEPPAVVQSASLVFFGPQTHLAYSKRGKPLSGLGKPALVTPATNVFQPPMVVLAPKPRTFVRSRLAAPTVFAVTTVFSGPAKTLVPSTRGRTKSFLRPSGPPAVVYASIRVRLAPSKRGAPKSRLQSPILPSLAPPVAERLVSNLVRVELADRLPKSRLAPPAVIGAAVVFRPVDVELAYSRHGRPVSRLFGPAVVGAGVVFSPLQVRLAPSHQIGHQRRYESRLEPPTVIQPATLLFFGPVTHLAPSKRGIPKSLLRKPAIIGSGIAYHGPGLILTYSRRGVTRSRLAPSPVVLVSPQVFTGPKTELTLSRRPGKTRTELSPPAVVFVEVIHPIDEVVTSLAPPPKTRDDRYQATSYLFRPIVIGSGVVFRAVDVELAYSRRGAPKPHLSPPALVGTGIVYRPPIVHLAPSRRGKPTSHLFAPAIEPVFAGIRVTLAPSRRGIPKPHLSRPAAVGGGIVFRHLQVSLAPSHQIGRQRHYRFLLEPPTVVQAATLLFSGPVVHLAPSKRGQPRFALRPPVVVGAGIVFAALRITLVSSHQIGRQRQSDHLLRPPAVVGSGIVFSGIRGSLTYSRRGVPKSTHTFPPTVGGGITFRAVKTNLAYSRRGKTKSGLGIPPLFEDPQLGGTLVQLVTRWTPPIQSSLAAPAVVGSGIYFRSILVRLAPGKRGLPKSRLAPPSGSLAVFRPIDVTLAPSHRDRSVNARLASPAVVGSGNVFRGILGKLAPSTRGKPKSRLAPPAVVGVVTSFRPIFVHLAPSRRAKTRSLLFAPTVARVAVLYPIATTLVRIRPVVVRTRLAGPGITRAAVLYQVAVTLAPRPKPESLSRLAAPVIVGAATVFRPLLVSLVDQRTFVHSRLNERLPHSDLKPPIVVGGGIYFYPVGITLAPSTRLSRKPFLALRPPTVVATAVLYPIKVTLASPGRPSTRSVLHPSAEMRALARPVAATLAPQPTPETLFFLRPPTVVRPVEPHARPAFVHLAPSTRGKTFSQLLHIVVPFAAPHGDVCGFDVVAPFLDCGDDSTPSGPSGSVSSPSRISGTTTSPSAIRGGTSSSSSVSGDDGKAT